jgi:hypothetical protein
VPLDREVVQVGREVRALLDDPPEGAACPVLVGSGKRFFEHGTPTTLKRVGVE